MCRGPQRRARHPHQLWQEDRPHRLLLLPQARRICVCVGTGSHRRRSPRCRSVPTCCTSTHRFHSIRPSLHHSDLTAITMNGLTCLLVLVLIHSLVEMKPCYDCDSHFNHLPDEEITPCLSVCLSVLSPCMQFTCSRTRKLMLQRYPTPTLIDSLLFLTFCSMCCGPLILWSNGHPFPL